MNEIGTSYTILYTCHLLFVNLSMLEIIVNNTRDKTRNSVEELFINKIQKQVDVKLETGVREEMYKLAVLELSLK